MTLKETSSANLSDEVGGMFQTVMPWIEQFWPLLLLGLAIAVMVVKTIQEMRREMQLLQRQQTQFMNRTVATELAHQMQLDTLERVRFSFQMSVKKAAENGRDWITVCGEFDNQLTSQIERIKSNSEKQFEATQKI